MLMYLEFFMFLQELNTPKIRTEVSNNK